MSETLHADLDQTVISETGEILDKEDRNHVYDPLRDIPNIRELIPDRSGNEVYQAYLHGMSKALSDHPTANREIKPVDILNLFLDVNNPNPDSEDKQILEDHFEEMVYNDDLLREYSWELGHFKKKSSCDRGLAYNKHKGLNDGKEKTDKTICGSFFCPTCNDIYVGKRLGKMATYVMECLHTHFTFTLDQSMWQWLDWENIGEFYRSIGEAVKYAYKKHYGLEVGILINLHTFSSLTLEWQPHADVFVSMKGVDGEGKIKDVVMETDQGDEIPPDERVGVNPDLLKTIRQVFTVELVGRIMEVDTPKPEDVQRGYLEYMWDKVDLQPPDSEDGTYWVRQNLEGGELKTKKLFEVDKTPDGVKATGGLLGDTLRYFKRLPITDKNIKKVETDRIAFTTDKRKKKDKPPMQLSPEDFYYRISQHVKPSGFRSLRPYGVYSYNHEYHDKVSRREGYNVGGDVWEKYDLEKNDLQKIAHEVYEYIDENLDSVDPNNVNPDENSKSEEYKDTLLDLVFEIGKVLEDKGYLPVHVPNKYVVIRIVRSLMDYAMSVVETDYYGNETGDKPVLSVGELKDLMSYVKGSTVKEKFGSDAYKIWDSVRKKVYNGLENPKLFDDQDDLYIWVGYHNNGKLVNESMVGKAIFNVVDFKNNEKTWFSLLKESNNWFPSLKDPPDRGCKGEK